LSERRTRQGTNHTANKCILNPKAVVHGHIAKGNRTSIYEEASRQTSAANLAKALFSVENEALTAISAGLSALKTRCW
jgi:hypothetical protein